MIEDCAGYGNEKQSKNMERQQMHIQVANSPEGDWPPAAAMYSFE
jgi:hypothetical protein